MSDAGKGEALSALLQENRRFAPSEEFAVPGSGPGRDLRRGGCRPGGVVGRAGEDAAGGSGRSTRSSNGTPPFAKWFVGGRLNASVNCVDRHVEAGLGDRVAFHWVGEPEGDTRTVTYADLLDDGVEGGQRADRARGARPATGSRSTCR